MKIIKQSYEILTELDEEKVLYELARGATVCYKSEDKLKDKDFSKRLITQIVKSGHNSVLRQFFIKVLITTDIGVARQLMRHDPQYPLQESTRYCNYTKDKFNNEIIVIEPYGLTEEQKIIWRNQCMLAEKAYFDLINSKATAEKARSVLPLSTKTEFILFTHIEKWRHILKIRTASGVQPETKNLCLDILTEFKSKLPTLFGDL